MDHGIAPGREIRLYTDERPGSETALCLLATRSEPERRLTSLVNAYGVEHSVLRGAAADLDSGLAQILADILAERPAWDSVFLIELDPRDSAYNALVRKMRRAGFMVECIFYSGTWYEDTAGLDFADYLAARPVQLRNTFRRKCRKLANSKEKFVCLMALSRLLLTKPPSQPSRSSLPLISRMRSVITLTLKI